MWTAKILSTEHTGDQLLVGIEYTNGARKFSESLNLTGGSFNILSQRVSAKLETLEASTVLHAELQTKLTNGQVAVEQVVLANVGALSGI